MEHISLTKEKTRVESGPIQFNDDWPGYFIRGDEAAGLCSICYLLSKKNLDRSTKERDIFHTNAVFLEKLANRLESCIVNQKTEK